MEGFIPEKCGGCSQTTEYLLPIDRGTVDIMKAISTKIRTKGMNEVHPRNEMEINGRKLLYRDMVQHGLLTSNQVGNLSRPRFHGLIARVKGKKGTYCLTTKGALFLKGESVPKFAVISKVEGCQIGYWMPEKYRVRISDFKPDQEYWESTEFVVEDSRVIIMRPREVAKLL